MRDENRTLSSASSKLKLGLLLVKKLSVELVVDESVCSFFTNSRY